MFTALLRRSRRRSLFRCILPLLLVFLPSARAAAQDATDSLKTAGPVFIARDVEPTLKNAKEVKLLLERLYPSGYRDTALDVTVVLWLFVEADGAVGARQILKSSGYAVFDRAAEEVAEGMVFHPAKFQGEPVGVWINQAIHFKSGDSGQFLEGPGRPRKDPGDGT